MASSPPWLVAVFFLGRVFIDTPVVSVHAFVSGDAITFAAAPGAARPPYALQSSLLAEPTDTQSIATHGSGGADIDDPGSFNDLTYKENVRISKLAEKSARGDRATAPLAYKILAGLEGLRAADTISYNGVLKAYAKSSAGDAVQWAEKVLRRMEDVHEDQREAYRRWENMEEDNGGEDGLANEAGPPRITVKPNIRTYSTLLDAYSRHATRCPPEESEALLERVWELYEATGDEGLRPNAFAYNTVLNHWAKCDRGAEGALRAADLLEKMELHNLVDIISYNTVADAWARSGVDDAGSKAEAVLRQIIELEKVKGRRNKILPNVRTYCCVIDAWSRSTHPASAQRADRILAELESKYELTQDESLQPNQFAFSAVINAYVRSNEEDKASLTLALLRRMEDLWKTGRNVSARPNIVVYNSVLNACATTRQSTGAVSVPMDIVRTLYNELTSETSPASPDHYTYGTVLKACINLLPTRFEEEDFVRSVFNRCCEDGQVSWLVGYLLRQAATDEVYRELIPPDVYDPRIGQFEIDKIPRDWRRNVVERRSRRRSER